jgi:aminoglycoside phosphotransferase (APT) family kinase protein
VTAHETPTDRRGIYYWKCDRAAAFHGTAPRSGEEEIEEPLREAIAEAFLGKSLSLKRRTSQGNHLTWLATIAGEECFVRVEDGPERDDYLEVESHVLGKVARAGVPVPRVLAVDATRAGVPFAWQVLENSPHPDLNSHFKRGALHLHEVAEKIGTAVARWQAIEPAGFGPFRTEELRRTGSLIGFHRRYEDYFFLNLDRHLDFLAERAFLSTGEAGEMRQAANENRGLVQLRGGCLVHKDLALWNVLGSESDVAAFIDWDDCISGDPMDDLSLLGCFHDGPILARALAGYTAVRPLPADARRRFWLHLLRNMIVKAVIRVGAGYFDRTDGFFLIGTGTSGSDLKTATRMRLAAALRGLREDAEITSL